MSHIKTCGCKIIDLTDPHTGDPTDLPWLLCKQHEEEERAWREGCRREAAHLAGMESGIDASNEARGFHQEPVSPAQRPLAGSLGQFQGSERPQAPKGSWSLSGRLLGGAQIRH